MGIKRTIAQCGWIEAVVRVSNKVRRLVRKAYLKGTRAPVARTDYGVRMLSNWGDKTFVLCFKGGYGKTLSNLLKERNEEFIFVDIGANQGLYSLIAAQNARCVKAYAFEPVASTFANLAANIEINSLDEKIVAIQAGISDRDARIRISTKPGHSGAASLHHSVGGASETITVRRIASISDSIVPAEFPLVVKVDVEGHEQTVLAELVNSPMFARVDTIFYEVDESWSDASALSALLPDFTSTKIGTGLHYDVLATRAWALHPCIR